MDEEHEKNLLCIPFSDEQLKDLKQYADMNGMEVEEFLKNVCLTFCLQQMEYLQGQRPEAAAGAKLDEGLEAEPRKPEVPTEKPASKELLDGPLALDQQCIMDLYEIKREVSHASNNQIIMVALKLGLNQLNVALGMRHRLEK